MRSHLYWSWRQKQELLAFLIEYFERSAPGGDRPEAGGDRPATRVERNRECEAWLRGDEGVA